MNAIRRIARALMNHAAWLLPDERAQWAKAMQHELPQIENDLEALTWAGGCLIASYGTLIRQHAKIVLIALLSTAAIAAASWRAGQHPYLTPANHQIFREDSTPLALIGFFIFIAASIAAIAAFFAILDADFRQATRAGRLCAIILGPYLAALILVSLLTPRTIVNIGDSYCYDLWCLGINQVNTTQTGGDILYTANVTISVDSTHPHHVPADQAADFFYVKDDQGHHYPLLADASFKNIDVTLQPGESLKSSLSFRAPQNAKKLYLMGNDAALPWVHLYFASDISLFHRRTLLRIL